MTHITRQALACHTIEKINNDDTRGLGYPYLELLLEAELGLQAAHQLGFVDGG